MKGTKDMAKLVFNYGAMGSSKTANALMVAYNYEERGQHALILKPARWHSHRFFKNRSFKHMPPD